MNDPRVLFREPSHERQDALDFALAFYQQTNQLEGLDIEKLLKAAEEVMEYLMTPDIVILRHGPVYRQDGSLSPHQPPVGGNTMQLHDDEQVSVSISALDAKGQDIPGENFTATVDDVTVVTVAEGVEGVFEIVAGLPGSAVVTYTDGTLSITESFDVVPGSVATLQITEGTPEKQPVAPPPTP